MSDTHAQSVSYVRKTMIAQQVPPITEKGAIKWVRENLFRGWLNILLTILSLFIVYYSLSAVLPWAFGGVWNAGSLTECREVLFSFYKSSHDGACWAVIEDRWLQLTFGFYPPDLYWRPILAFLLFFVALAPVLFSDKVPGQLIWFSLAYPFLAAWLIWGGSFWVPILAAMGFIVAYIVLRVLGKFTGPIVANIGALVAAIVWWSVLMAPISDGLSKMVGNSRFDATVAALEQDLVELPVAVSALEAQRDAKTAEIATQVEIKDEILAEIRDIRSEEFALQDQIDPKDVAFQRLDGAQESIEDLMGRIVARNGAPALASDASESDIARAEAARESIEDLIDDIQSLLGDALSDIEDDTVETAAIATQVVPRAAQADPSILDDIDTLVTKQTLTEPLADLAARAMQVSTQTSQPDLAALRADTETAMSAVQANIETLNTIQNKVIATNVDDLEGPQSRLLDQMAQLASLRDEQTVLAQATFRLSSQASNAASLLTSLETLYEREASIPEFSERAAALREQLPREQRRLIAINQLPDDASREERATLNAYLDASSLELSTAASVREDFSILGRVGLEPVNSREIGGFMLALIIGVAGIVLSLPLGILLALGRQSHLFIVNKLCVAFIEIIRGVPLIVWLFTASLLLNYFLPPGSNFDLMLRVIIMVTLFASAYIAEVIRGGLAALPTGQYEGADSLGLSYWQAMQLIILPQAMKISIPGIVNTFIGLFKDTTLVVFIGLLDPIGLSNAIRADTDWNGIYWELFVFIGLLFFIFCFSMGRYSLHLERKLQREHR